ncbi:glycosyltransferase [Sphingobium tyrosinilyticum]|uniref:Glycosyltransferase n=1 Tax=Sphingobium tyrosinilyticum TaxID=2715436 RepID=A0ABV9EZN3_9SPHN
MNRRPRVEPQLQNNNPIIAIGNYDFRPSGTVVKSIEIAAACAKAGLPVELWVVRDEGALRARVPASVPIFETGSAMRLHNRGLDLALNIPALATALRRRRPTLFLSGGNHLHLAARIALGLSGRRRSIQLGARASNSAHHGKATRWQALIGAWSNRLKFGGADFIVAVSHALAAEIQTALPQKKVGVIANGVDLAKVDRLVSAPFAHHFLDKGSDGPPVLVTMGRIVRQKGFDLLVSALGSLRDIGARLMIIGDGNPDQVAALKSLAEEKGVTDRLALLGYQDNPFAILSRADLFVSASRWEGASNALIEALACGLPIVATDCPTGNREVVEAGPYGTLAPVEDVEGLADAIRAELASHRSKEAQSAGARRWSLDHCMSEWVLLLRVESRCANAAIDTEGSTRPGELF